MCCIIESVSSSSYNFKNIDASEVIKIVIGRTSKKIELCNAHYIRNLPENLRSSSPFSSLLSDGVLRSRGPELYELGLVFSRPTITDRKLPKLDYPLYRVPTLRCDEVKLSRAQFRISAHCL